MARHGIPAHLLEIELTESSMMGGSSHVLESLSKIRDLGIKLLVDDFGTGYSSLAQLQLLDFDILKVDKAFTSRIEQTEQGKILFTAIITMAHALGMRVVAEGVETGSQLAILRALACDEVQGYFISFPQAAATCRACCCRRPRDFRAETTWPMLQCATRAGVLKPIGEACKIHHSLQSFVRSNKPHMTVSPCQRQRN